MDGISPPALALLAVLVFFAGVVDALAGGGGLITLPAYLAAGLPPGLLLGTNKLSSSIGTVMSAAQYTRKLRFSLRPFLPVVGVSLAGSWAGARLAIALDPDWLRGLLLVVLPAVAWVVYSRRDLGSRDRSGELGRGELLTRSALVAFPIGCYDGFFGPGTGTFFALAFARVCRYDLLRATAASKVLNLASNLAALAAFLWAARVAVPLGAGMGLASVAGHYVGSHLGVRKGAQAIRPAILVVCGLLFVKLLADSLSGS